MLALYRLFEEEPRLSDRVMLLNFASAKNPGGGFLKGSQAQEESLARSSGLYPCLTQFLDDMYAKNRKDPQGCLYSDDMIYSPKVPFFRYDDGSFLEEPICASVISAPAPNCGAAKGVDIKQVVNAMRTRLYRVLFLAKSQGLDVLILGAWGCGVFCNPVRTVAQLFLEALSLPEFSGAFKRVCFPIPDARMLGIFRSVLVPSEPPSIGGIDDGNEVEEEEQEQQSTSIPEKGTKGQRKARRWQKSKLAGC
eukprot:TRINITY_DN2752_c2_g1_i3.p1 TRINITY_DN2752_c2_g1~~TRINITY_DN2752_c2_g1_i3.p1  ORF type:complete len:251 (+),score=42.96 TRINITY_DN2752_c2_g1_i3:213-965(+)